jgi:hypothetical protein
MTTARLTPVSLSPRASASLSSLQSWCELCKESGTDGVETRSRDVLWMCMVCGHIGCGRYQKSHAVRHYELSSHRYAIELQNQYVWDYGTDGYIHRVRTARSASARYEAGAGAGGGAGAAAADGSGRRGRARADSTSW